MKPRFRADADLNHKIVIGLRQREPSVDFLSTHEGRVVGVPDLDVLRIAAESARILVSHDRNWFCLRVRRRLAGTNTASMRNAAKPGIQ